MLKVYSAIEFMIGSNGMNIFIKKKKEHLEQTNNFFFDQLIYPHQFHSIFLFGTPWNRIHRHYQ